MSFRSPSPFDQVLGFDNLNEGPFSATLLKIKINVIKTVKFLTTFKVK